MSVLEITDLTHAFADNALYTGASLSLYKGEHMGVVGQNGTGKSTLLKLLLGELVPTGGNIRWQRGLDIGHLDQYVQVDMDSTIDVYLHTAFAELYRVEARLNALYDQMADAATERMLRQAATWQELLTQRDFYAIDSHEC